MRISPIISFSVNFIIYAIFDEDLSQDLSARHYCSMPHVPCHFVSFFPFGNGMPKDQKTRQIYLRTTCESFEFFLFHQFLILAISRKCDIRIEK